MSNIPAVFSAMNNSPVLTEKYGEMGTGSKVVWLLDRTKGAGCSNLWSQLLMERPCVSGPASAGQWEERCRPPNPTHFASTLVNYSSTLANETVWVQAVIKAIK